MTEYDQVPYDDFTFPEAHPGCLGAIATVFGLEVPATGDAHILDLGCASGGHILPIASTYPGAHVVGVDHSAVQIARGQRQAQEAGLPNVELHALDLNDEPDLGRFDFIVCHGVYSWIPAETRHALWRTIRRSLAPRGVAMVSANVDPGWRSRGAVRAVLERVVPADAPPTARIAAARDFLAQWGEALADRKGPWSATVASELALLAKMSDAYLLHEHLAPINEPVWFDDFAADAASHGLRYVSDALLQTHRPLFGEGVRAWRDRRSRSLVETEALNDLLGQRFFRRSLFVAREAQIDPEPHPLRLERLWVTTRLARREDGGFVAPEGAEVDVEGEALQGAVGALVDTAPAALPVTEVAARAGGGGRAHLRHICEGLLTLAFSGVIELRTDYPTISGSPGPRPRTHALARLQAATDRGCVNLRHRRLTLRNTDRAVLRRLDGEHDRDALAAGLAADSATGEVEIKVGDEPTTDPAILRTVVDAVLTRLAKHAFLG